MYCTPLEVHNKADTVDNKVDKDVTVENGEIELDNTLLIADAFPSSDFDDQTNDQTVRIFADGSLVDDSEYEINLRDGVISETGTALSSATNVEKVRYKASDIPNETVENAIAAATEHIDNLLNTTFGGTVTRTGELYDGEGYRDSIYQFEGQPVQTVSNVEVNKADIGRPDDWRTMTEGRAEDYVPYQSAGIQFMDSVDAPDDEPRNLKVTYEYGYPNVPEDINLLCRQIVIRGLANDQTFAAVIDGVDDFNPETTTNFNKGISEVVDEWKIRTDLVQFTNLSEKGQES